MTGEKIEGTFFLDGLIQGKLPGKPDAAVSLREWVDSARAAGIRFHLEQEGQSFNLLADNRPAAVATLGPTGIVAVGDKLQDLLDLCGPESLASMVSTVRSTEYRPNAQVQTLYVFGPDGQVHSREQMTPINTTPPTPPVTVKQRVKMALIALVVIVGLFAVLSLFLPIPQMIHEAVGGLTPVDVKQINFDRGRYADFIEVGQPEKVTVNRETRLAIKLKRTAKFPTTQGDFDSLAKSAGTVQDRLAAEALVRGYITVRLFYDDQADYEKSEIPVKALREKQECTVTLPMNRRFNRVEFCY
jgi:hypothetical protein